MNSKNACVLKKKEKETFIHPGTRKENPTTKAHLKQESCLTWGVSVLDDSCFEFLWLLLVAAKQQMKLKQKHSLVLIFKKADFQALTVLG